MARAVMRPLARGDKMQVKWIDESPTEIIVSQFIKPNDRLTSFERLEIYNRQYWFRVRAGFNEDFPGLRAILGDKKFERLADAYLAKFPSASFTLRNLGSRLASFIKDEPHWTKPHKNLALDLVRLEWAHIEAFDNETLLPLKPQDLAGVDAAKLRLRLQPHLTLLKLQNEVDDFLIALKTNSGLRSEASNAVEKISRAKTKIVRTLKRKNNHLAVHRHEGNVFYKRLEPAQFALLSALQSGATLEEACAQLAGFKISGDLAANIHRWFAGWMVLGWFCGLKNSTGSPTSTKTKT